MIQVRHYNPEALTIETFDWPSVGISTDTPLGAVDVALYADTAERLVISIAGSGAITGTEVYVDGLLMKLVEA